MSERYARNKSLISAMEQELLKNKTVAVIGLGGLGGHIAEQLARLGFGRLILIDGDIAEESNLNRQLFVTEEGIGRPKVDLAAERIDKVNDLVSFAGHHKRLTPQNGAELLAGADLVMDAVDSIPTRLDIEAVCKQLGLPLVHGSIGGWWGQVSLVLPGDNTLSRIYPDRDAAGEEKEYGNPAFTPAIVASIQVAEAVKYCLGRPGQLRNRLLCINLLDHEYFTVDFTD
ncbi:MAG: HesA/MoeB/ThiF family protein [Oscillospiraceae bacterium]|nr:HesA/MoeB/ThiF family protein [Oscillospiraceae bacterium]